MAIVEMNKISIIGLAAQKNEILTLLMRCGVVQIDDSGAFLSEEELMPHLQRDSGEAEAIETEQKLFQTEQAIELITKACKIKAPFLKPKDAYQEMAEGKVQEVLKKVETVNAIQKNINAFRQQEATYKNSKAILQPWTAFDIPLGKLETRFTKTMLGTVPAAVPIDEIRQKLDESECMAVLGDLQSDQAFHYVYLISHKTSFDAASGILKEYGFLAVSFEEEKTVSDAIRAYEISIEKKQEQIRAAEQQLKAYESDIGQMKTLFDYLAIYRDKKKIVANLLKTRATFFLSGWLPADKSEPLKQRLAQYDCSITIEKPEDKEAFPILLHNNRIVTPFEGVTNMYSTPGVNDIDPNPIMAIFYIIFFGMMLSDAGYGLIIALVCGFVVHKMQWKKGEGNMFKMLALCGISTMIWGIIFGSAFGDLIPLTPIISPLDDVMILMGMSLLFGIVHIYVGLGIKAYNLIRQGKPLDALFDVGLWIVFITGVCLLILPIVAGDIGALSVIGKYLAIVGALGLVLTQGRANKGIFMKGFKGVSSLYDITSYFADILSYTRLMALCLSTGVIGQVINLLGRIAGPIPAILIGIVGHIANLLINALGAYVHTSRLQYVEFFGKFYEGGGSPFQPFQYKTKYTRVNEKEM